MDHQCVEMGRRGSTWTINVFRWGGGYMDHQCVEGVHGPSMCLHKITMMCVCEWVQ